MFNDQKTEEKFNKILSILEALPPGALVPILNDMSIMMTLALARMSQDEVVDFWYGVASRVNIGTNAILLQYLDLAKDVNANFTRGKTYEDLLN